MKNKNLAKILALSLGAGTLMPDNANALGELNIRYQGQGSGVASTDIRIIENSSISPQGSVSPSYYIYIDSPDSVLPLKRTGLDINTNTAILCPLEYDNVPSGSQNALVYQFFFRSGSSTPVKTNTFPSDLLITSKIVSQEYSNVLDVVEQIKNTDGIYTNNMPLSYGAGINKHGTNYLSFTRKDSTSPSIDGLVMNGDGTANLSVTNVLAGETITPQYSSNLVDNNSWISDTNHSTYVPVTFDSFGVPTSTVISNVPAVENSCFYRVKVE